MDALGILQSVNIALTDELLTDIEHGDADVYLDEYHDVVRVATGLDTQEARRFTVKVEGAQATESSWLKSTWIQTFCGGRFDLADPRAEDVRLLDVAHALSMLCRYTGHVSEFYSVAQHSVLVSRILEQAGYSRAVQLNGLLHDGAEAYVQDVNRPLKGMLPHYKTIENMVAEAVYTALGGDADAGPDAVHWADNVALFVERDRLMHAPPEEWDDEAEYRTAAATFTLEPLSPTEARDAFLRRYLELTL